ncbi:TATA element modulatory factor [Ostrinia nubilalis]|uniref:TATA element modulatory factor n=1 Tax=Ostrinia nubilalis TaxID=29057 RepID=UPI0030822890
MNWFDTSGLTSLAKTALKEAQKTIDKALDIQDESGEEPEDESPPQSTAKSSPSKSGTPQKDSDFFSSWGLTVSAESGKDDPIKEQPVVTESPSKSTSQSLWGSFAGSFFEQPTSEHDSTIVQPPKAKSMNVIADAKYGSQDDLFSKSQLVMSDGAEGLEFKIAKTSKDDFSKVEDRRGSTRSNRLSLVSSRNSSDSVEVLSHSLKTTPDSEAASGQSMSHSSSVGQKLNSDSVEILPDSLVSPSSIECLGFDSYSSDRNSSSTSSHLSPGDVSDKKSTPVGERTERAETADSVSLVADDDEDTMSYNSISECTAPTVLDTDDKSASPFPKMLRSESRKILEKDFIHLEQSVLPHRMQISENSSNDGSWSDRTLNADNESIILENTVEEPKKEMDQEDILMEKLSDSSSFYNVNVSVDMLRSESSAFVNVEKQQCSGPDSDSSQKEGSLKERTSPISSDSKSDLVKIGSDRTSGHTSGDELETATSSDIEIIPSPNGDGHFCRSSPAKYGLRQSKFDGTTSPNLVDLVLGKSLATKIRGHNRELSEASIQSNTSDESQSSENERLMRRLCEMAEILEARENRLMEVSRNNAELAESNADLKSQLDSMVAKHESGEINMITEDYTQRMSALEKKFQQAIREKDQLRKQLDTLKTESSRKNSSDLENSLKEKDDVITQLQEEGEKLARQQLQHSNIIKKLRAKEKDNEQVIKSLRDKIADQTSELERLKRSLSAKEELEVSQVEAVYRLTTANKKLDAELAETKSALDDATHRLESTRTSLDAARRELTALRGSGDELARTRAAHARLEHDLRAARADAAARAAELARLRADVTAGECDVIGEEQPATCVPPVLKLPRVLPSWRASGPTSRPHDLRAAELARLRADVTAGECDVIGEEQPATCVPPVLTLPRVLPSWRACGPTSRPERRWASREEALRREVREARELACADAAPAPAESCGALLAQLAALQRAALQRDTAHAHHTRALRAQLGECRAGPGAPASCGPCWRSWRPCSAPLSSGTPRTRTTRAPSAPSWLAALQRAALQRDTAHAHHTRALRAQLGECRAGPGAPASCGPCWRSWRPCSAPLSSGTPRTRTTRAPSAPSWLAALQRAALQRDTAHAHHTRALRAQLVSRGARRPGLVRALLAQLAALQRAALQRDTAHAHHTRALRAQLAEAETSLAKAVERERVSREEAAAATSRLSAAEGLLQDAQARLDAVTAHAQQLLNRVTKLEEELANKTSELDRVLCEKAATASELRGQLAAAQQALDAERAALDTERKRNSILQIRGP